MKVVRTAHIETQLYEIEVYLTQHADGTFEESVDLRVIGGQIVKTVLAPEQRFAVGNEQWVEIIRAEEES